MDGCLKKILGCLGVFVVLVAVLVGLNWGTLSRVATNAKATFGDMMSASTAIQEEFGATALVGLTTGTEGRHLTITVAQYQIPEGVSPDSLAWEMGALALATTSWTDIDVIDVEFKSQKGGGPVEVSSSRWFSFPIGKIDSGGVAPDSLPADSR